MSSQVHPVFTNDVRHYHSLIFKEVMITLQSRAIVGWVAAVDPVTSSIILVNFSEECGTPRLVMGHAIRSIDIINHDTEQKLEELKTLFPPTPIREDITADTAERLRNHLKSWFEENRLPVNVEGDKLLILDAVTIHPPYTVDKCYSTNLIILNRVRKFIENMPEPCS